MMKYAAICLPVLGALAACGASGPGANKAAGNIAAPTNAAAPTNMAAGNSTGAASGPLSAYVGHLPSDAVNGSTFLANPQVRAAVEAAVSDADVRRWVLREDVTSNPIGSQGGRIVATGCESHNCGAHNWSILIDPEGTTAEVCYARDTQGDRGMWYVAGRPAEERPGACPTSGG
jgi:hypothetical protein